MNKKGGKNFKNAEKHYKDAMLQKFYYCLTVARKNSKDFKELKSKALAIEKIKSNLNDRKILIDFSNRWISNVYFSNWIMDAEICLLNIQSQ